MRLAPLARELDARFDRFGARVAKVDAIGGTILDHIAGQQGLWRGVIQVRDMQQLVRLCLDGLYHPWMAVTQGIDRDPAQKVQVSLAFGVIDIHPLPAIKDKLWTVIGMYHVLFLEVNDLLRVHHYSPFCYPYIHSHLSGLRWSARPAQVCSHPTH